MTKRLLPMPSSHPIIARRQFLLSETVDSAAFLVSSFRHALYMENPFVEPTEDGPPSISAHFAIGGHGDEVGVHRMLDDRGQADVMIRELEEISMFFHKAASDLRTLRDQVWDPAIDHLPEH